MPIDPLPTPPSRDDAANFAARADTFVAALVPFQAQANALEANVNLQAASTQAAVSSFASLLASTGLSQFGDPPTSLTLTQSTDSVVGSILYLRSSRGSAASRADSTTGDYAGEIRFEAMQGGSFFVAGLLRSFFIDDAGGFAGGLRFYTPRKGATTNTEVLRLEADTGLSMYGANPVIDQNRGLRLRSFTVATLPAASLCPFSMFWASDVGGTSGGVGLVVSDGSNWTRLGRNYSASSAYDADANITLPANFLLCPTTILQNSALTANRMMTLPTQNIEPGDRLRVTRTAGGAFSRSVGGLKSLTQNTWCDVEWTGGAWVLTASGAL